MASNIEDLIAAGYVHRYEASFTSVSSGASVHIGLVVGPDGAIVLGRSYAGDTSLITIELFQATYTGGTAVRTLNRRIGHARPAPVTMLQGVTPGALGSVVTAASVRAGSSSGNASITISPNENQLYLKANTSYVVRITNGGNGTADIGAAFDLRPTVDGTTLES